ncbi:MAG: MFS transporter [Rubrobacter sp.]|nr:MFS transporter [Rubrobacter sp.]
MANIIRQPCDEGVIRSGKGGAPCSRDAGPWVLAATILGSSLAFSDATTVNVALPALQEQLEATAVDAQWVVEAYALFLAALLLVGGSLGDHYGRRRIFSLGIALFAAASVWCGLAGSPEDLIAARAAQGVGGALLVPGSLAIISASFEESRRGRAIGTWAGFSALTSVLGPVLGGFLIEVLSWRWIFFVNIPVAVAVLAITLTRVPESRDEEARRLDIPGGVLATVGLGGLVFGLIESSSLGFSDPLVVASLVVGVGALIVFLFVEAGSPEPMMPPSLFRSRNFTGANTFTLLLYFALGGALYFLPFNLIQVHGYSATAAGAAFAPAILFMFFLSRYTGALADRFGPRLPLVAGPLLAAAGFALLAAPGAEAGSYWTSFFPAVFVLGLGLATFVPTLTTVALNSVAGSHSGLASGINNAFSRTAGLLAVAVLGLLMFPIFSAALDSRVADLELSPGARAELEEEKINLGAADAPEGLEAETAAAVEEAIAKSYVTGFRAVMLTAAGLALASALSAALLIEDKRPPKEPEP